MSVSHQGAPRVLGCHLLFLYRKRAVSWYPWEKMSFKTCKEKHLRSLKSLDLSTTGSIQRCLWRVGMAHLGRQQAPVGLQPPQHWSEKHRMGWVGRHLRDHLVLSGPLQFVDLIPGWPPISSVPSPKCTAKTGCCPLPLKSH